MTPLVTKKHTFAYEWMKDFTPEENFQGKPAVKFPRYFKLAPTGKNKKWTPIDESDVPKATGLLDYKFKTPDQKDPEPYITPTEPDSVWNTPGPAAGPFQASLGDGSVVTYYWYRFADQPAVRNSSLTPTERETLQKRVEAIHRNWTPDKSYIAEPTVSTPLAEIDPALVVTPPRGMEIGFVPIATKQGLQR